MRSIANRIPDVILPTEPEDPAAETVVVVSRTVAAGLALLAAAVVVLVLVRAPAVPVILAGGCLVALFLSYPLRLLEKLLPRRLALVVVLGGTLLLIASILLLLLPPLLRQLTALAEAVPRIVHEADTRLRSEIDRLIALGLLPTDADTVVRDVQDGLISHAGSLAERLSAALATALTGAQGVIVQTFGMVFVAVYLLLDIRRLRASVLLHTPSRERRTLDHLFDDVGGALSRYVAGTIVIAILQGLTAMVYLSLLGVPYPLVLAIWIAVTSTIPYIGTWFGAPPAIVLAALQSPLTALATFALFLATTTVIGNVVTPRVQGEAVRVHPVIVLLAVVAAGQLFGIVGLFLAVPALAVGRVLVDFLRKQVRIEVR